MAGNGSFSSSGRLITSTDTRYKVLLDLPLFIKDNHINPPAYSVNQDILFLFPVKKAEVKILMPEYNPVYDIMTAGEMKVEDLTRFLIKNNPGIGYYHARLFASYYFEEAGVEGVNHDIAFSQMCLETGFLNFSGIVNPEQNNFCGLGAVSKFNNGEQFPTRRHGVRAHIQHLKAYASFLDLENSLIDTRFNYVKRGSASTVDQLTGRWATDPEYSNKIKGLLERLYRNTRSSDHLAGK